MIFKTGEFKWAILENIVIIVCMTVLILLTKSATPALMVFLLNSFTSEEKTDE